MLIRSGKIKSYPNSVNNITLNVSHALFCIMICVFTIVHQFQIGVYFWCWYLYLWSVLDMNAKSPQKFFYEAARAFGIIPHILPQSRHPSPPPLNPPPPKYECSIYTLGRGWVKIVTLNVLIEACSYPPISLLIGNS